MLAILGYGPSWRNWGHVLGTPIFPWPLPDPWLLSNQKVSTDPTMTMQSLSCFGPTVKKLICYGLKPLISVAQRKLLFWVVWPGIHYSNEKCLLHWSTWPWVPLPREVWLKDQSFVHSSSFQWADPMCAPLLQTNSLASNRHSRFSRIPEVLMCSRKKSMTNCIFNTINCNIIVQLPIENYILVVFTYEISGF